MNQPNAPAKPLGPIATQMITPAERPRLARGSHGAAVEYLQVLLDRVLSLTGGLCAALPADGEYGTVTAEAVALLQFRLGMPISGNVNGLFWARLETIHQALRPFPPAAPLTGGRLGQRSGNQRPLPQILLAEIALQRVLASPGNGAAQPWGLITESAVADSRSSAAAGGLDFLSLCLRQLLIEQPRFYCGVRLPAPEDASGLLNRWAKHQRCLMFSPSSPVIEPTCGDIVVFADARVAILETVRDNAIDTFTGTLTNHGQVLAWRETRARPLIRQYVRLPVCWVR